MPLDISTSVYKSLSESEKKVIDYIAANEGKVETFSITMIATRTYTSTATVSRAIKKIGFPGGISELRYYLTFRKHHDSYDQTKEDQDIRHVNKILAKSYRECMQTIDNIVITDILKVVEYIKQANRIILCSLGTSAQIAKEFQEQLLMLDYNPILIDDEVWMKRSNLIRQNDLVFIITAQNTRPVLYQIGQRGKHAGAKLVTCVCIPGTNLEKISDITIHGYTENIVSNHIMSTTSRLSLMIIMRTITEYLVEYE